MRTLTRQVISHENSGNNSERFAVIAIAVIVTVAKHFCLV